MRPESFRVLTILDLHSGRILSELTSILLDRLPDIFYVQILLDILVVKVPAGGLMQSNVL